MARDSAAWFDERRSWGIVSALAAVVVGAMSLVDLDDVYVRDVVIVVAAVGVYLIYGAVPRFPAWAPFAVAFVATTTLNVPELRTEGAMFFVVLALAHLALTESRRVIVHVSGVAAVAVPAIVAAGRGTDWGWNYWMMGFAFGWGFGELGYRFRLARDELASARALIADQAALDERQRIARDVHDVLGHSLTIVMLQLTAARHLLRRDPDEADAALADAERVGRESLNQVRRTVGMLRVGSADPGESATERAAPSPTLEDLGELLADYRSAGIAVRSEVGGPIASLDASRSMAGYRIVQEAMANVSKHSPAAETVVTIKVDDAGGACQIRVDNHGGGHHVDGRSGGFGLVGMRERARSVGGSVHAGPIDDGWRVSADLPPLVDNAGGADT
jgi:signal transduction histidine kinase